jgi:hypothetical protein
VTPRFRITCALAITTLSAATVAVAGPATASPAHPTLPRVSPGRVLTDTGLQPNLGVSPNISGGLKTFTAAVNDGGTTFHYTMVGKNPAVATSTPSSTIQVKVIPLRIVLGNGDVYDPTVGTTCDSTSALARTNASPVFNNLPWTFNGVSIGNSQYVDAFRRAEFWKYTKPSGINPGYHVKLNATTVAKQTVNVPLADSAEGATNCAAPNNKQGAIEINWLDNYFQNTLLPSLTSQGLIGPNTFPFFVVGNVIEYITTTSNCCVLGYHNAYNTAGGIQTYGISDYDNGNFFAGSNLKDIEIATHEVAEWMDDPLGTNPTKPWGNIGQVSGCQSNLEVGDPLTGTTINRAVGGFTYHLQELANFAWFYHQPANFSAGSKFSNNGTFTTAAAPCP